VGGVDHGNAVGVGMGMGAQHTVCSTCYPVLVQFEFKLNQYPIPRLIDPRWKRHVNSKS